MTSTYQLYQRLTAKPFGRQLFALGFMARAPYFATVQPQIRDVVEGCAGLVNPYAGRLADPGDTEVDPRGAHGGFAPRFDGRVETRFERKGLRVDRVVRDVLGTKPHQAG